MGKLYYQDKAGDIKVTSKGIPSPTDETAVAEALNEQSETLFKTINGQTITGEGNIEVGGGSVIANPEMEGDEPDLTGIEIDGNKYKIPEGGSSTNGELVTDISLYCEIFSGYFEVYGSNIPEYTTAAELYEILAPYNESYIVTEFENQYTNKVYEKVSSFYCQRHKNEVEIDLLSDFGNVIIYATDEDGEIVFNPTFQNFNIDCDLELQLVYGENTALNLGWLQDLTVEDYGYLVQKVGTLISPKIVIFKDSEAQNPPFTIIGTFAELTQNIVIYTANGPIIIAVQPDDDQLNFNVVWDYFVLPGGSSPAGSGKIVSYYVENSTKRAVPVVKFIDCLSDTHNPRIYNADEFYALVQEAYAENNDEHHEFNLPTYFILNSAQPINLNAIRELTGQEGVWIRLFSEDDDPTGQSSITYSTEGYTSASENYIRVTDFDGAEGIVIVFYYGGE